MDKLCAAPLYVQLMRFTDLSLICGDCNNLDSFMKGYLGSGVLRLPVMAHRRKFSATVADIRSCVFDAHGNFRGHSAPAVVAE